MKSIRTKILLCMTFILLISLVAVGSVSVYLNINSTNQTLKQSMLECAEIAAERVEQELTAHLNVSIDTGCIARLTNENVSLADKKEIINQRVILHGYQRGDILDINGISILDGTNYSEYEWFQEAVNGNPHISEPIINKSAGEMSVFVAAPLWEGGIPNTEIVGVIFYVPQETFLNDIVTSIQVSANGSAYILSAEGNTIAHKNSDNVLNEENTINDSKTDADLFQLASLEQKMINGESGFGEYFYGGYNKFLAFSSIGTSDGWSIGINAPISDFMGSTYLGIVITIVLTLIFCIIAFLLALRLSNSIGKPMEACTTRLELLAQGNLHEPVPVINKKDETGRLASATESIVETMRGIISDLEYGLDSVANGNFTVKSKANNLYLGDFQQIKKSLAKIIVKLSDTLNMVRTSADQVSVGADQVAEGAQTLSQGSTEQAASVEGMALSIKEMTEQLISNSEDSQNARLTMELVGDEMTKSNEKMQEMTEAMNKISESSTEIGKIIKTIEDIAFQTNILALNAAVEAARAGDAGKGFAVVADEVRNLASKSAEASKNTSELIKGTLSAINDGTKISDETAETLLVAVEKAQKASEVIDKISDSLKSGAAEMTEVTVKVDQISSVVQSNSATAEESAAASQELFGQAQMLQKLIEQFKLLEETKQNSNSDLY